MKKIQLIFILTLLGYYLAQTTADICATEFSVKINKKCEDIHSSCEFTDYLGCISKKENTCSEGDNDPALCSKLYPDDYPKKKCVYDYSNKKCKQENTACSDFNNINPALRKGNRTLCSQFTETTSGKKCFLGINGVTCNSYYVSCLDPNILNNQIQCVNNILESYNRKCAWDTATSKCFETERKCDVPLYNVNEEECHNLKAADNTKQKCVYDNGVCYPKYIECENIPSPTGQDSCDVQEHPLKSKGTFYDYDYENKCLFEPGSGTTEDPDKCIPEPIYCEDYSGTDESICIQYKAKDTNKRCVYDSSRSPNKCYEEYKTCESYTSNKIDTSESGCTGIKLLEKNEKCVYIEEEDNCVTKSSLTHPSCEDYTGNSKRECESIVLSPTNRSYCILDKDMKCKERPLFCEEAFGEDECLYIAKANDTNRRCAYDNVNGKCYEEYIRCEDWIPNNNSGSSPSSGSTDCSDIKLYNGKKCTNNSMERCYSDFKECEDAKTEEECKLIAKTGVTDPERKVCAWFKNEPIKCQETFKYCSDYRKICGLSDNSCENFCENKIKPYDESGENIDIRFKCIYEDDIGCQRAPVECNDTTNPIECDLFSQYIKDKDKRHCVYYNKKCHKHSRKCQDVEGGSSECRNNIIENNIIDACNYDNNNNECVEKHDCYEKATIISTYYKEMLCLTINPNCTYSGGKCIYTEENTCKKIKFYSNETTNKETCEKMVATDPRKKCTLKKDLSGCEEVYRELEFSTSSNSYSTPPDASNQGNSSGFIEKGIHLIMALFCLLI